MTMMIHSTKQVVDIFAMPWAHTFAGQNVLIGIVIFLFYIIVALKRIEPLTSRLTAARSDQLSYESYESYESFASIWYRKKPLSLFLQRRCVDNEICKDCSCDRRFYAFVQFEQNSAPLC